MLTAITLTWGTREVETKSSSPGPASLPPQPPHSNDQPAAKLHQCSPVLHSSYVSAVASTSPNAWHFLLTPTEEGKDLTAHTAPQPTLHCNCAQGCNNKGFRQERHRGPVLWDRPWPLPKTNRLHSFMGKCEGCAQGKRAPNTPQSAVLPWDKIISYSTEHTGVWRADRTLAVGN